MSATGTTRDDWLQAGLTILVEEGAAQVKVLTLAQRLGCSRSSFYWFFADRAALMAGLLERWRARNTVALVDRAARPAVRVSDAVLNVFDCWADPALFDPRLDFAVRDWARRDAAVEAEVRAADAARVAALAAMFARFGAGEAEALVRARTLYFMQIGFYALGVQDSDGQRRGLLASYVEVFSGQPPEPEAVQAFLLRNGAAQ